MKILLIALAFCAGWLPPLSIGIATWMLEPLEIELVSLLVCIGWIFSALAVFFTIDYLKGK